jgi:hypothetical protein
VPEAVRLPGHRWAEPSVSHLRQLMRAVYEDRDEAARRGRSARERMVERFSPQALAAEVGSHLDRIEASVLEPRRANARAKAKAKKKSAQRDEL